MYSRIQVLNYPEAPPGKCALCGSQARHDGRVYIDLGTNVPRYGALYFCSVCLGEICGHLGWTDPLTFQVTQDLVAHYKRNIAKMETENGDLRIALSHLQFLDSAESGGDLDGQADQPGEPEEQRPADTEPEQPSRGSEDPEPRFAEPVDERGSQDVRDTELAKFLSL